MLTTELAAAAATSAATIEVDTAPATARAKVDATSPANHDAVEARPALRSCRRAAWGDVTALSVRQ
jgi:hypothetical protein